MKEELEAWKELAQIRLAWASMFASMAFCMSVVAILSISVGYYLVFNNYPLW